MRSAARLGGAHLRPSRLAQLRAGRTLRSSRVPVLDLRAWWLPSPRNGGRLQFGMVASFKSESRGVMAQVRTGPVSVRF